MIKQILLFPLWISLKNNMHPGQMVSFPMLLLFSMAKDGKMNCKKSITFQQELEASMQEKKPVQIGMTELLRNIDSLKNNSQKQDESKKISPQLIRTHKIL